MSRKGVWLGQRMVGIPAQCLNCGHEFFDDTFNFTPGTIGISLEGNSVPCPRCGGRARLGEGTFNARRVMLELVEGPEWTRSALERLETATRRAQQQADVDPGAAVDTVATVAPSLRGQLLAATEGGRLGNFLAALGILVALWLGYATPESITEQEIQQIVEQVYEQTEK